MKNFAKKIKTWRKVIQMEATRVGKLLKDVVCAVADTQYLARLINLPSTD